jgi:hypothetical protein
MEANLVASIEKKDRVAAWQERQRGRATDQVPTAWPFDTADRGLCAADAYG